jgi:hypothetical protein
MTDPQDFATTCFEAVNGFGSTFFDPATRRYDLAIATEPTGTMLVLRIARDLWEPVLEQGLYRAEKLDRKHIEHIFLHSLFPAPEEQVGVFGYMGMWEFVQNDRDVVLTTALGPATNLFALCAGLRWLLTVANESHFLKGHVPAEYFSPDPIYRQQIVIEPGFQPGSSDAYSFSAALAPEVVAALDASDRDRFVKTLSARMCELDSIFSGREAPRQYENAIFYTPKDRLTITVGSGSTGQWLEGEWRNPLDGRQPGVVLASHNASGPLQQAMLILAVVEIPRILGM